MKRLLYVAIFCLLTILPANTHAKDSSQSSDAPYLYYFSSDIDAVVIERADGTDTRVLGADLVANAAEEDQPYIFSGQQGWSPSGKWLAWRVIFSSRLQGGTSKYVPFIVSVDGSRHYPFTDEYDRFDMAWSPTDDVLAVWGHLRTYDDTGYQLPPEKTFLMIYDFEHDEMLFETDDVDKTFGTEFAEGVSVINRAGWSSNGEYFFIQAYDEGNAYLVLRTNGEKVDIVPHHNPVVINTVSVSLPTRIETTIANFDERGLVIEDIITRETVTIGDIREKPDVFLLSPDHRNALFVKNGLWLWSEGQPVTQLLDTPRFAQLGYSHNEAIYWSSGTQYALINGNVSEEDSILWAINVQQHQIQEILTASYNELYWHPPNWYWLNDSEVLVVGLRDHTRPAENYYSAYSYSLKITFPSMETEEIDFVTGYHNTAVFNKDLSVMATVKEGPVIYHQDTGEIIVLRPDYDSFLSGSGGLVSMDESGQWLLTKEEGLVSSGGSDLAHVGISRIDGRHRRDLTHLYLFAEWLPEHVPIDQLPPPISSSILPEPEYIIQTSNWSTGISWSPDGNYIGMTQYLNYNNDEGLYIWY